MLWILWLIQRSQGSHTLSDKAEPDPIHFVRHGHRLLPCTPPIVPSSSPSRPCAAMARGFPAGISLLHLPMGSVGWRFRGLVHQKEPLQYCFCIASYSEKKLMLILCGTAMHHELLLKIMSRYPQDLTRYANTLLKYLIYFTGPQVDS